MAQADIILEQIQAILYPELIIMFGLSIMMFSAGWYLNAYFCLRAILGYHYKSLYC